MPRPPLPGAPVAPGDLLARLEVDHIATDGEPPAFLRPEQHAPWRRLVRALGTHGAAILAEPVGCGKTWIALAASASLGTPTAVIAPALLRDQWRRAIHRSGTDASVHTLEALSRGRLPPDSARLVVIDEAHRLRGRRTRRVHWLAPWLPGRRVAYLTGTPIVNGPRDLVRLLRLALADDALRLDGVPSLEALARHPVPPQALRRLVIREMHSRAPVPVRAYELRTACAEEQRGREIVAAVDTLRLGETAAIARLIRTVLLDAGASSDAAWFAALRRYHRLLLHAREAGGLSRALLRRFAGPDLGQLVLWPLLGAAKTEWTLPVEDLEPLERSFRRAPADTTWLAALRACIEDQVPTVCFTRHVATARRVVEHLGPGTAWVDGCGAGIGHHRLPRRVVLAAFGPERHRWTARRSLPTCLVLTDVGAEGLDLQGAARVVHLDLPWHAMGLTQRLGRCARLGQRAVVVEEVRRRAPRDIEDALAKSRLVTRKGARAAAWMARLGRRLGEDAVPPTGADAVRWHGHAVVAGLRAGPTPGVLCLAQTVDGWRVIPPEHAVARVRSGRALAVEGAGQDVGVTGRGWWEAIRLATARPRRTRPDLVTALTELAHRAGRLRDREAMRRLDALLRASSVSHSVGVERRLLAIDLTAAHLPDWAPDPGPEGLTLRWVVHLVDRDSVPD